MTASPAHTGLRSVSAGSRPRFVIVLLLAGAGTLATQARAATAVGRVSGTFDTTPTGAATYSIPIPVAAGMNGLRPDIALAYNSQGGEGYAGAGWTLAGVSEITRCPLSRAVDGRVQGVRFTSADRFCLDGHPLILLSGIYGSAGAQYRTEIHGFERVIVLRPAGQRPCVVRTAPSGWPRLPLRQRRRLAGGSARHNGDPRLGSE